MPAPPVRSAGTKAVEFTAELSGSRVLTVPADVAARLPKAGRVRVLLLTDDDAAAGLDAAYAAAYARVPEDASLSTSLLPHLAVDGQDWA